jgi:pimeloyl-ACP methyl ester carboxylesterase
MATGFATPEIARLYADVPANMVARLLEFRARYACKYLDTGGVKWRYIDTGTGDQVILALSGAACIAEVSWLTIDRLGQQYRVIAPDYPAIDTNIELGDGLARILDQEGIRQAHVMGGSAGGLVAQFFVRRHPDRTSSLILSHTLLPDRATSRYVARILFWLRLMPPAVLRAFFRRTMSTLMPKETTPEILLFKAQFSEIVNYHLTKAQIISLMKRTVDLAENTTFAPDDLKDWTGRILLIMSEDDPASPEPVRRTMTTMYPQAEVRLFSGGGHATSILKQEEYIEAIEQFIGK